LADKQLPTPPSELSGENGELESGGNSQRRIYLLSAKDAGTGTNYSRQLAAYMKERLAVNQRGIMANLALTLGERRSMLPLRTAVAAENMDELIAYLLRDDLKFIRSSKKPDLAFVFTGQGAQWARMGFELIEHYPVFKETLTRADACVRNLGARWSLIGESIQV
jgi:acyl transferase domain-containing protein